MLLIFNILRIVHLGKKIIIINIIKILTFTIIIIMISIIISYKEKSCIYGKKGYYSNKYVDYK